MVAREGDDKAFMHHDSLHPCSELAVKALHYALHEAVEERDENEESSKTTESETTL